MTIFEIGRPGTHERTNRRLAGCVNTKGSSALYTRDGTRKNDGAAIVQEGQSFCTVKNAPFTLILSSLSKCSSETSPKGRNSPTPALAKIISTRPFTLPTVL